MGLFGIGNKQKENQNIYPIAINKGIEVIFNIILERFENSEFGGYLKLAQPEDFVKEHLPQINEDFLLKFINTFAIDIQMGALETKRYIIVYDYKEGLQYIIPKLPKTDEYEVVSFKEKIVIPFEILNEKGKYVVRKETIPATLKKNIDNIEIYACQYNQSTLSFSVIDVRILDKQGNYSEIISSVDPFSGILVNYRYNISEIINELQKYNYINAPLNPPGGYKYLPHVFIGVNFDLTEHDNPVYVFKLDTNDTMYITYHDFFQPSRIVKIKRLRKGDMFNRFFKK